MCNKKMLPKLRKRKIMDLLQEKESVKTGELSDKFSVSEITIRKDLDELAEQGALERTHGGAVAKASTLFEPTHGEKKLVRIEEKRRIGKKAASLVKEKTTICIGTGTTTMQMIEHLDGIRDLSVVTNSLNNGYRLSKLENIDLSIIGGDVRRKSYALVGTAAEDYFKKIYCDQLFLGVNGVSVEHGLTTPTLAEANVNRLMIEASEEVTILADHSKFGTVVHGKIGDLDEVDNIITDTGLSQEKYESIKDKVKNVWRV